MSHSMKIAIITPGVLPVPAVKGGAVETLIDFLIEYNESNLEHDITVFGVNDTCILSYDFTFNRYTKFRLLKLNSISYRIKRKLYSLCKRDYYYNSFLDYYGYHISKQIGQADFDVVVVENRPGFVLSLPSSLRAKIVLHLHNDTLDKDTKNARMILQGCNAVFTVSDYVRRRVETIMQTDIVSVLYNGIDLSRFKMPLFIEKRSSFGLSDNDFVVVYTGRIEPIKGVKELLEAFAMLKEYRSIKLLIVGGGFNGSTDEDEFMIEMRRLSETIKNQVVFTGFQSYENMPAILHLCDLAVIPSICEDALTMTSLEDMAVGLPLIVTRSGGIPEAVDEECAIIVEKDTMLSHHIAGAIISLFNDKQRLTKMSAHAKERAELFSKEKYAESFFEKIQMLAKR